MCIAFIKLFSLRRYDNLQFTFPGNISIPKKFEKDVIDFVELNIINIKDQHPMIYILYSSARMLEKDGDKYFHELQKYYELNKEKFKGELIRQYLETYYSFCLKKAEINIEDVDKYRFLIFEYFDTYFVKNSPIKEVLDEGFLYVRAFLKAVSTGILLNNTGWVETFIEKNKKYLSPVVADDAYNFAMAFLHFQKRNFPLTLIHLTLMQNTIINLEHACRSLRISVFYENGDYNGLMNLLNNEKDVLKKSNINKMEYRALRIFHYYMIKISNLRFGDAKDKKAEALLLIKMLKQEKQYVLRRAWMYEKLKEM